MFALFGSILASSLPVCHTCHTTVKANSEASIKWFGDYVFMNLEATLLVLCGSFYVYESNLPDTKSGN